MATDATSSKTAFLETGLEPYTPSPSDDLSCTICHDLLIPRPASAPPTPRTPAPAEHSAVKIKACGHFFGAKCLEIWVKTKNTCPMCRRVLFNVEMWSLSLVSNWYSKQMVEHVARFRGDESAMIRTSGLLSRAMRSTGKDEGYEWQLFLGSESMSGVQDSGVRYGIESTVGDDDYDQVIETVLWIMNGSDSKDEHEHGE